MLIGITLLIGCCSLSAETMGSGSFACIFSGLRFGISGLMHG